MSPVYAYKCGSCGDSQEQKRGFDESAPATMCGDCLVAMERVFSATPIHFKGSGFYSTDKGRA